MESILLAPDATDNLIVHTANLDFSKLNAVIAELIKAVSSQNVRLEEQQRIIDAHQASIEKFDSLGSTLDQKSIDNALNVQEIAQKADDVKNASAAFEETWKNNFEQLRADVDASSKRIERFLLEQGRERKNSASSVSGGVGGGSLPGRTSSSSSLSAAAAPSSNSGSNAHSGSGGSGGSLSSSGAASSLAAPSTSGPAAAATGVGSDDNRLAGIDARVQKNAAAIERLEQAAQQIMGDAQRLLSDAKADAEVARRQLDEKVSSLDHTIDNVKSFVRQEVEGNRAVVNNVARAVSDHAARINRLEGNNGGSNNNGSNNAAGDNASTGAATVGGFGGAIDGAGIDAIAVPSSLPLDVFGAAGGNGGNAYGTAGAAGPAAGSPLSAAGGSLRAGPLSARRGSQIQRTDAPASGSAAPTPRISPDRRRSLAGSIDADTAVQVNQMSKQMLYMENAVKAVSERLAALENDAVLAREETTKALTDVSARASDLEMTVGQRLAPRVDKLEFVARKIDPIESQLHAAKSRIELVVKLVQDTLGVSATAASGSTSVSPRPPTGSASGAAAAGTAGGTGGGSNSLAPGGGNNSHSPGGTTIAAGSGAGDGASASGGVGGVSASRPGTSQLASKDLSRGVSVASAASVSTAGGDVSLSGDVGATLAALADGGGGGGRYASLSDMEDVIAKTKELEFVVSKLQQQATDNATGVGRKLEGLTGRVDLLETTSKIQNNRLDQYAKQANSRSESVDVSELRTAIDEANIRLRMQVEEVAKCRDEVDSLRETKADRTEINAAPTERVMSASGSVRGGVQLEDVTRGKLYQMETDLQYLRDKIRSLQRASQNKADSEWVRKIEQDLSHLLSGDYTADESTLLGRAHFRCLACNQITPFPSQHNHDHGGKVAQITSMDGRQKSLIGSDGDVYKGRDPPPDDLLGKLRPNRPTTTPQIRKGLALQSFFPPVNGRDQLSVDSSPRDGTRRTQSVPSVQTSSPPQARHVTINDGS